jgi:GH25 family lysozyme M1 (1,4-beta-N-acetylmuramidase)/uncharacterized protein YjdB
MRKGLGLFSKKSSKRPGSQGKRPEKRGHYKSVDLEVEDFDEDEYEDNQDYEDDRDYGDDYDDESGKYYEDEEYEDDYEEESDEYYEDDYEEDDYVDEEYSEEELEEYYDRTGRYPESRDEVQEPVEPDYEFSDEDYEEDYEGEYPEDEPSDEYYEDDRYEDEGYYEDDYPEGDYPEDDYPEEDRRGRKNGFIAFVKNSTAVERIAAIFALLILAGGISFATLYASAMSKNDEINAFSEVGENMDDVQVVGQSGLIAIADAQRAKAMAAAFLSSEEEEAVAEATVEESAVVINMTLTTIKSDIKVKFINSDTGKLVGDVPFEIDVKNPDGSSVTYDDHDRDGIIYKTKLTAGKYTVTPKKLPDSYSKFTLNIETKFVTVKDTVEMKAVDVKNEIKKESQVNVAKEEAGKNQETESELPDTVDWDGESWVKDGDGDGTVSYKEIKKKDVPAPSGTTSIKIGNVAALSKEGRTGTVHTLSEEPSEGDTGGEIITEPDEPEEPVKPEEPDKPEEPEEPEEPAEPEEPKEFTIETEELEIEVGQSAEIKFKEKSKVDAKYSADDTSVAKVDDNGKVTGVSSGTTVILINADGYYTGTVKVTVKDKSEEIIDDEKKIALESYSFELKIKETAQIKAKDSDIKLKFKSADESVAKVDKKGKITAVAAGKTTITVKADKYEDTEVEVTVVKEEKLGNVLPIELKSVTLYEGQTKKIKVKGVDEKLTFKSGDKEIAKVSEDGTITAVKEGTTKVTVSADGYEDYVIEVIVSHKELKDKDGNTLYVLESEGKYRVATYADYEKYDVFYKKVENKNKIYHGWATIDGKTYFFDNSGNFVTGEQVINHVKYTFGSDGVLAKSAPTVGIDVSKHNGSIDWKAVKNSGVNFVIIRCGYRGYSTGVMVEDPMFRSNIKGALAAGLRVGVYYYSQAVDEVEAVEEASMCVNLLSGYGIQLPVYMDVEASGGRGDQVSVSQRTANIKAFCGTIQSAGYKAGLYANKAWLTSYINTSQLTNYSIWLAQYAKEPSYGATRYDMWQYTSKGRVSGISGKVDMNICY